MENWKKLMQHKEQVELNKAFCYFYIIIKKLIYFSKNLKLYNNTT